MLLTENVIGKAGISWCHWVEFQKPRPFASCLHAPGKICSLRSSSQGPCWLQEPWGIPLAVKISYGSWDNSTIMILGLLDFLDKCTNSQCPPGHKQMRWRALISGLDILNKTTVTKMEAWNSDASCFSLYCCLHVAWVSCAEKVCVLAGLFTLHGAAGPFPTARNRCLFMPLQFQWLGCALSCSKHF